MKILLEDFIGKNGEGDFSSEIWGWGLHQESNDNGVRTEISATSTNLVSNSTIFPRRNIHK